MGFAKVVARLLFGRSDASRGHIVVQMPADWWPSVERIAADLERDLLHVSTSPTLTADDVVQVVAVGDAARAAIKRRSAPDFVRVLREAQDLYGGIAADMPAGSRKAKMAEPFLAAGEKLASLLATLDPALKDQVAAV